MTQIAVWGVLLYKARSIIISGLTSGEDQWEIANPAGCRRGVVNCLEVYRKVVDEEKVGGVEAYSTVSLPSSFYGRCLQEDEGCKSGDVSLPNDSHGYQSSITLEILSHSEGHG